MPAGNDVMRPNYFCKSCKCYSILPSCPRETRQCRSNFHLLIRSLFIDTYLYRVSNIIIKIIKMVPRVIMLLGHFVYNVVVMKLAAVSNFMSYWFYYIMCITYVDRCRPISTDVVRTCSNFACGCSLAHEDVYIHRTEFTWIFYIFESKSNISKQISRDHWYFCVARMWTEKFVIFIYLE